MRPTTATNDNVFDFQALLHPGTVFEHPKDVVMHPSLTLAEKRAILASWASDASAIASCPALRAPEGLKMPVSIDAILEAFANSIVAHRTRPAASRSAGFPRRARRPPEEAYHVLHKASNICGCAFSSCLRAKANSRCVKVAPRRAPSMAPSRSL